jgi:histidyl-tRNA synthetase
MTERNMFPATLAGGSVDVMVTLWDDASRGDSLALAGELRHAGIWVDVYPEANPPRRLDKQLKYASSRNIPFVTLVGDDERASGMVGVRDMRTRVQEAVPRAEVVAFIAARVNPRTS